MTSRRRIFPKLRQIVSFYNILLLSKFEVNPMFQTEVISLRINGGVLYRTFKPPVRAVFQLNIMIFFAQHSKKRQNCTLPKDFSKKHSKSAKIQFFQTLRYNTPPIDTQTINSVPLSNKYPNGFQYKYIY